MRILYSVIRGTQPNSHLKFSPVKSAVTRACAIRRAVPCRTVPCRSFIRTVSFPAAVLCRSRGYDDC
ncbi:hypothetical protein RRG08_045416 [Elysia crispata]|uniref:Uncharacterized protein n=1 Tax=Elysia crispata TaxID=231223 RepID=A0AAE0XME9_9GAST|nr:hypothetical protein RRG08_045416 [Elysia crispata]